MPRISRLFPYLFFAVVVLACAAESHKGEADGELGARAKYYGLAEVNEVQRLARVWGEHPVAVNADSEFCRSSLTLVSFAPFCTEEGAPAVSLASSGMMRSLDRLSEAALRDLLFALKRFE